MATVIGEPFPAPDPVRLQRMMTMGLAAGRAGVWEWDAASRLLCCGATMSRLFALTPEEGFAGVSLDRLLAVIVPDDRDDVLDAIQDVRTYGGLLSLEYRTMPRGVEHRILAQGHYHLGTDGVVVRAAGIIVDLTEVGPAPVTDPLTDAMYALAEAHGRLDALSEPLRSHLLASLRPTIDLFGRIMRLVSEENDE